MSQTLAPISDVSSSGVTASSGGTLFGVIDEAVASDADYLTYTATGNPTATFGLTSALLPTATTGWGLTVRCRYESVVLTGDPTLVVYLLEGATQRYTANQIIGSDTFANYTFNLSDMAAISDYTNLRLRLAYDTSTVPGAKMYVSQAFLTMPDALVLGGGDFTPTPWVAQGIYPFPIGVTSGYALEDNSVDKADLPLDVEDALGGQICTLSGLWYPKRRIVFVDGLPYGDEHAPRPDYGPPDIPLY